jgi:hypothetical protein
MNNPQTDQVVERLSVRPVCGYRREESPRVEPTALAGLALLAAGLADRAAMTLDWLADVQSQDGSLGIDAQTPLPCWPTGWAVLAWNAAIKHPAPANAKWSAAAERAVQWMLSIRGTPVNVESDTEARSVGHDSTLEGWPWVSGTHSWVEPTAINMLALRSANKADHPRCREAVKLLLDRQLPTGGWNYGNTTVLDNLLRSHIQPTGLALTALADEPDIRPKVQVSLDFLVKTLSDRTTTASLCYAIWGLAAFHQYPKAAQRWLAAACRNTLAGDSSPYHLALLVLAAKRLAE